ncbi:MAG: hypothetical protein JOY52_13695 [Hyphomicrobiales bacterium]|nr:hypothetical protein [Hyphomicrobiales bacterium]
MYNVFALAITGGHATIRVLRRTLSVRERQRLDFKQPSFDFPYDSVD